MAFRRPKKPIRPRVVALNADSEEEMELDSNNMSSPPPSASATPKNGHSQGLPEGKSGVKSTLSFGDDLEDGEVFQVKKSSVSRRLMTAKKETSRRDEKPKAKVNKPPPDPGLGQGHGHDLKVKVKEKRVERKETSFLRILNGREAEALHMEEEEESSEEEEKPKFRRPASSRIQDEVRRALELGQIPDANLIHEARKRKQQARERGGGGAEFIPVSSENVERYKKESSRLVREDDDNDQFSDEERLDFTSVTNAAQIDRERRIEDFKAFSERRGRGEPASDSESEELDQWESQQIRKGVSQVKMQDVARELYPQSINPADSSFPNRFSFFPDEEENAAGGGADPARRRRKAQGRTQAFLELTQKVASIEEVVSGSKKTSPELLMKQISERLERLRLSRDRTAGELSRLEADMSVAESELAESEELKSGLSERFILYQNLRGYVTDLVDCLRCKVPEIEAVEERIISLLSSRREKFAVRRRQDVKDQMEEVAATINIMGGPAAGTKAPSVNAERTRRAAEREGRRMRRRRLREKEGTAKEHKEGLSSDDEEPEIEWKGYLASRESVAAEASEILSEVHEDIGTISGILSRFEEWREQDFDSYKDSYAYLCLPKCVGPLIRVELIGWDPLKETFDLLKHSWIRSLLSYSFKRDETLEQLRTDPDSRLIPSTIEKIVLPWISRIVDSRFDPFSCSQTRGLVNCLTRLIEEFSISPNSKPMHALFEKIIGKLKESVDADVYVPIYAKSAISNTFSPANSFLSRQFWSSVKLLDNMSKWQGLLSEKPLQALALDSLLTRYSLLGIRVSPDLSESLERARGVIHVLPRAWLFSSDAKGKNIPNGLQQLSRCLISIVQETDCSTAANRIKVPEVASILKTIGYGEEAQIILKKYS